MNIDDNAKYLISPFYFFVFYSEIRRIISNGILTVVDFLLRSNTVFNVENRIAETIKCTKSHPSIIPFRSWKTH